MNLIPINQHSYRSVTNETERKIDSDDTFVILLNCGRFTVLSIYSTRSIKQLNYFCRVSQKQPHIILKIRMP